MQLSKERSSLTSFSSIGLYTMTLNNMIQMNNITTGLCRHWHLRLNAGKCMLLPTNKL